jgi:hypothetical protein
MAGPSVSIHSPRGIATDSVRPQSALALVGMSVFTAARNPPAGGVIDHTGKFAGVVSGQGFSVVIFATSVLDWVGSTFG